MTLKFGKYKGQQFKNTPKSYQNWLLSQEWFKLSKQGKMLHKKLNGWDGYGRKGQAIYDEIFEQEKKQALRQDCRDGICSCCEGSMYYGV